MDTRTRRLDVGDNCIEFVSGRADAAILRGHGKASHEQAAQSLGASPVAEC